MPIYSFDPNKTGDAPNAKLFSSIDLSEPFVARIWGLIDISDITLYENRKQINDGIMRTLTECLLPAHDSLLNIVRYSTQPNIPIVTMRKQYMDLYNHLSAAYKDRMQMIFKNNDFDIDFLFKNEQNFELGMKKFKLSTPSLPKKFYSDISNFRNTWQRNLIANIRNDFLQHRKDREIEDEFFTREKAIQMFDDVWKAIEYIVYHFLIIKFPIKIISIIEIPEDQRDPQMPKRYCFGAADTHASPV
ncbi:MAG: hypothetical protein PHD72_03040 [Patescibacteria group bacterium]|nr:hypothetical protein [Patescibacteria group bacterium]